jgi:hypothetical protein
MDEIEFLEKAAGIIYLIIGLSVLLQGKKLWIPMLDSFDKEGNSVLFGAYSLFIGIPYILLHNIWEPGFSVLVTIFGWSAFIKGIVYLTYPQALKFAIPKSPKGRILYMRLGGVTAVILSLIMIYEGFCL